MKLLASSTKWDQAQRSPIPCIKDSVCFWNKYRVKSSGMQFKPLIFQAALMERDLLQGQMRLEECENMRWSWQQPKSSSQYRITAPEQGKSSGFSLTDVLLLTVGLMSRNCNKWLKTYRLNVKGLRAATWEDRFS